MAKKKLRPLGHTLLDLETLLLEMTIDHDLQWGDVLNLVRGYLEVHVPGAQEEYVDDGGHPEFYYGPPRSDTKNKSNEPEE
jgi:hypothetical protein